MLKTSFTALRVLFVSAVVTGIAYPLFAMALGMNLFPSAAGGSLVVQGDKVIGSELIAQKFQSHRYFQPRPSASDYATVPSGASNQGATNAALLTTINERKVIYGLDAPAELLLASASGLDPHVSPTTAIFQIDEVMTERALGEETRKELEALVTSLTEPPTFGILGRPRVNVLKLNIELDRRFP